MRLTSLKYLPFASGPHVTVRGLMICVAGVAILLGGWAALMRSRTPGGTISSMIRVQPPSSVFNLHDEVDFEGRLRREINLQCQIIKSPSVLTEVAMSLGARKPGLLAGMRDPVAWLRDGLRAEVVPYTQIIEISMPGAPREHQAAIVDAVTNAFLKTMPEFEEARRDPKMRWATHLHKKYRNTLMDKRRELRQAEGANPEELEALRDEISILEEMARKVGLVLEELKLETDPPINRATLINRAQPR